MTTEQLISEGRRLQRRTVLLLPTRNGDAIAHWYGRGRRRNDPDRLWISVDATAIPGCSIGGWLSIFVNRQRFKGGRVEVTPAIPNAGVPLYGHEVSLLPPVDAIIARGSQSVADWLAANNWRREWRYNRNFRDRSVVEGYEAVWHQERSLYLDGAYATLGGWHWGWPDDDWHALLGATLLVQTYMDSEPWVEGWQLPSGELKVIQRIT